MVEAALPFVAEKLRNGHEHGAECALRGLLPPGLQAVCEESDFLDEYLHCLPLNRIGIPSYYPKLFRELQNLKVRNLIYPTKGGLYVHIYPDAKGERDFYISVEPDLTLDLNTLVEKVEARLIEYAERIGETKTDEDRERVLLEAIDQICTSDPVARPGRIRVTSRELAGIKYHFVREKLGLGALQPLLLDPYIEDISCSGMGPLFIEHKIFKSLQASIFFPSLDDLDNFVVWLGEWIKRPVTVRNPIVDAVLPDGSRINIVYGREIATRGSNFTIRKFSETPLSVLELIEFGTLDYHMAAYLSLILEEGLNVFVIGPTACGKTTTLNAITTFIPPDAKIVTIEDTPEVQVPHKNWVREVTRAGNESSKGSEVGMFDLLRAALRQRPDRIIIGEIRGAEGAIAFQAMQTGHGVMSTFHAASVGKLIQRLTGDPINIPKPYIDNLHVAVIQSAARGLDNKVVRRVLSINEILGWDASSESYSYIEIFRWNPVTDTFDFPGNMNSYLLEQHIAMKRGIPPHKRKIIYTELRKRASIFERIHKEKRIRSFNAFFRILSEAYKSQLL